MPTLHQIILPGLSVLLVSGCVLAKIDDIIDQYDTFGSTDASSSSTTGGDTSTSDTTPEAESSSSSTTTGADLSASASTTGAPPDDTSTTDTPDTTGPPPPTCGDGVQQADEECDTDDADGCLSDCTRVWTVFITSFPGTQGDIKGMVGAEYECRHRAVKAGLKNGERYLPWLSASTTQPVDRLYHARGPYRRVDGLQVAASWDALVTGALENPIIIDEHGALQDTLVFTGTHPDGTRIAGSDHCDDWTTIDPKKKAWYGASEATNTDWTRALEAFCGGGGALYCFEQP